MAELKEILEFKPELGKLFIDFPEVLFENIREGLCIVEVETDANHELVSLVPIYANDSLKYQLGIDKEEYLNINLMENSKFGNDILLIKIRSIIKSGQILKDYYKSVYLNKTFRYKLIPYSDKYIIALVSDLSSSINAKINLQKSEEMLSSILNSVDEVIFSLNMSGNINFISNHTEQIYKLPAIAFYDNPNLWFEIIHDDDKELVNRHLAMVSETNYFKLDYRIKRADGEIRWVHNNSKIVFENGKPVRIDGTVYDITDSKTVESELNMKNRLITGFYDVNPLYMGVVELRNNFSEIIHLSGNKSLMKRIGKNESDYPWVALADTDSEENYLSIWKMKYMESFESRGSVNFEFISKDNGIIQYHDVVLSYLSISNEGNPQFAFIINDISDRKSAELKIKEYAVEMEQKSYELGLEIEKNLQIQRELIGAKNIAVSANRTKSEFLANISHEIRTPLNAILGFAEIITEREKDQKLLGYAQGIISGGKTLLSMINDILDLSKIESGTLLIQNEVVDLFKLCRELFHIMNLKAKEKNIRLLHYIGDNVPQFVIMDEIRIRQILLNLISNGIKFTDSGYVLISIDYEGCESSEKSKLSIRISDTGIGIPENQQEIIFEAFRQTEGQNNRRFGGTGLGLTISQRLAELMNGRIELESKVGIGSKFKVIFDDVQISTSTDAADLGLYDLFSVKFTECRVISFVSNRVKNFINRIFDDTLATVMCFSSVEELVILPDEVDLIIIESGNIEEFESYSHYFPNSNVPIILLTEKIDNFHEILKHYNICSCISNNSTIEKYIFELSKYIDYELITSHQDILDTSQRNSTLVPDDMDKAITILKKDFPELITIFKRDLSLEEAGDISDRLINFAKETCSDEIRSLGLFIRKAVNNYDFEKLSTVLRSLTE